MMKYVPGDFSFINDEMMKDALVYDYNIISEMVPGAWNALKNHDSNQSFMFHTNGEIWSKIRSLMWNGHSGASASLCLRNMEYIAKNGWDAFVEYYNE